MRSLSYKGSKTRLTSENNRIAGYDLLRLGAAYLIIILHLSVEYISSPPTSVEAYLQWELAIKISALSRVGVPIFVMLSGAFLLDPSKNMTIRRVFTGYMPKLLATFAGWSFFYALNEQGFFQMIPQIGPGAAWGALDTERLIIEMVKGHYHMWYLYMLAGLYLISPLLRHITAHSGKMELIYFVLLAMTVLGLSKLNEEWWHIELIESILDKMAMSFVIGYIGYFVAGYLIKRYEPSWITCVVFIFLGALAFKYTYEETIRLNPIFGFAKPNLVLFSNYAPTVFIMSIALFMLVSKLKGKLIKGKLGDFVGKGAHYTLVIYLVHPYVIRLLREMKMLLPKDSSWNLLINGAYVYVISLIFAIIIMELYYMFVLRMLPSTRGARNKKQQI